MHHKNPFFQSKNRSRDLCIARILGINLLLLHSRITPLTIPSPQMRPKGRSSRGLCIARILGTHFALTHKQLTNPHLWRQNLKLWDLWRRFSGSTSFALTNNSAHNSESTNAAKTQIEGFVRGFARSVDVWDPFYSHSYTTQLTIPQIWRQNSESGGVCVEGGFLGSNSFSLLTTHDSTYFAPKFRLGDLCVARIFRTHFALTHTHSTHNSTYSLTYLAPKSRSGDLSVARIFGIHFTF